MACMLDLSFVKINNFYPVYHIFITLLL